jgi:hypothetical protein
VGPTCQPAEEKEGGALVERAAGLAGPGILGPAGGFGFLSFFLFFLFQIDFKPIFPTIFKSNLFHILTQIYPTILRLFRKPFKQLFKHF